MLIILVSKFGVPKQFLIFGESGGTSRPYQLAEWFGLCDLVADATVRISFALRTSRLRARSFFKSRCKGTSNIFPSPNFFTKKYRFFFFFKEIYPVNAKKCIFLIFWLPSLAKSQNCITMWLQPPQINSHYINMYII